MCPVCPGAVPHLQPVLNVSTLLCSTPSAGTHDIHALILGRAITGIPAFAN